MALFENFPYTNLQNLNLDWLIREIKKLEQGQVLSVNGQTGNVILYKDASVQLPSIEESTSWAFWRNINNTASGIQFTSTGIEWVNGSNRIRLLTVNDIPSTEGVLSVNGKAGIVVLIGSDINVSETDQRTIADALADIANNYSTLTATVGTHTTAITALQTASSQHGSDITALQTASSQHGSDISALQTASSQHASDITALQTAISEQETDIENLQTSEDYHTTQINNLTTNVSALQETVNTLKIKNITSITSSGTTNANGIIYLSEYYNTAEIVSVNAEYYPCMLGYDPSQNNQYFILVAGVFNGALGPIANQLVQYSYSKVVR